MPAKRGMMRQLADWVAAGVIAAGGPFLRKVGNNPGAYPRYRRQADRAGVHLLSTHYYRPAYRDADLPRDVTGERPLPGVDLREADQIALLRSLNYRDELQRFPREASDGLAFHHANSNYGFADAEALYCILREYKPRRLIEIGSGYSTRMACQALAANCAEQPGYRCEHICIEPYEMDWLDRLDVEVIRKPVQDADPSIFASLSDGDVLFIDSSHVIRPYGDVLYEYQRIIPSLARGVIVHVHDIFTPRDYPELWLRDQRRLWNEQYLLETMLAHSRRYRVMLALNWLKHNHVDELARAFPAAAERPDHEPGAFWFKVVE